MGLLKDVADIVAGEPAVRDWIRKNAKAIYDILRKWSSRSIPSGQELLEQRGILQQLKDDSFPAMFQDRLSFIEFLLCQVVLAVEVKERGVLISDFYLPETVLYFPYPTRVEHFRRFGIASHSWSSFITKQGITANEYYQFYAVTGNYNKRMFYENLRATLDEVVGRGRTADEARAFAGRVRSEGLDLSPLEFLHFFRREGVYALAHDMSLKLEEAQFVLSFVDPARSRRAVITALEYLHNFVMI